MFDKVSCVYTSNKSFIEIDKMLAGGRRQFEHWTEMSKVYDKLIFYCHKYKIEKYLLIDE